MVKTTDKSLGRQAFEVYSEAVGGKTFDGRPIPDWDNLDGDRAAVQAAWESAAQHVVNVTRP